jgi:hypothetical protein
MLSPHTTASGFDHLGVLPNTPQITAGSSITLTAINADSNGRQLSDVTASATFTISQNGSCDHNVCTATLAHGGQLITVTQGGHTANLGLQVDAGKLIKISLQPAGATVLMGASQTYSAVGYDAFNNSVENAYGATNFAGADKASLTITPDGSCAHAACTPSQPGVHTVTITYSGQSAAVTLTATRSG